MAVKKKGLGKGLDSLIAPNKNIEAISKENQNRKKRKTRKPMSN